MNQFMPMKPYDPVEEAAEHEVRNSPHYKDCVAQTTKAMKAAAGDTQAQIAGKAPKVTIKMGHTLRRK